MEKAEGNTFVIARSVVWRQKLSPDVFIPAVVFFMMQRNVSVLQGNCLNTEDFDLDIRGRDPLTSWSVHVLFPTSKFLYISIQTLRAKIQNP